ncbi:MAG: T9SS type A sorting domain-containing protein [Bacteroidetes bacterium]|nr:T9SS type A sorting domain-containing protein [Bacteroidota bacterium]
MKKISTFFLVAVLLGTAMAQAPLACYSFDGNYNDALNGRHLSNTTTTLVPGPWGGVDSVCQFNATLSSIVRLPKTAALRPALLSMSVWVKPESTEPQYIIFQKNRQAANHEGFVLAFIDTAFKFIKLSPDSGKYSNCQSGKVELNNWSHVGMVFTGDSIRLYVNAVRVAADKSAFPIEYDTTSMILGGSGVSFNLPFHGALNNLKIYDRVLTPAEISTDYFQHPGCVTAGIARQNAVSNAINMFPNPARDFLHLSAPSHVDIYSVNGKKLYSQNQIQTVPVHHLPRGLCFVRINSGKARSLILE